MTIVARLSSLDDAYRGIHALRSKSIVPSLANDGNHLVISVDDDIVPSARAVLTNDGRFSAEHIVDEKNSNGLSCHVNYDAENT